MTVPEIRRNDAVPTRQSVEAHDRSAPGRVTGKLKRALDAMTWEGLTRDQAAQAAGLTIHGVREALRKPHVKAYYLGQLEALRTSERARNIRALVDVRDQTLNQNARVNAVKALEELDGQEQVTRNRNTGQQLPGMIVVIAGADPAHTAAMRTIEAKPLKEQQSVSGDIEELPNPLR